MKTRKSLLPLALPLWSLAAHASAPPYDPQVLGKIEERVVQTRAAGRLPVLVFDVDDTLTDSRVRTRLILRDYGDSGQVRQADPTDADRLVNAPYSAMRFSIGDTLQAIGISDPSFVAAATQFWRQEFFSDDYCDVDPPIPGAAEYVDRVHRLGGFIVYLTGRAEPVMKTCTRYGLLKHHFTQGAGTLLLMKPSTTLSDLDFKRSAFSRIRTLGNVVAGFENEPANINAYQAAFPGGIMVFLDTIRSDSPVQPNEGISWIPDFRSADGAWQPGEATVWP